MFVVVVLSACSWNTTPSPTPSDDTPVDPVDPVDPDDPRPDAATPELPLQTPTPSVRTARASAR